MSHRHARRIAQVLLEDILYGEGGFTLKEPTQGGIEAQVDRWEQMVDEILQGSIIKVDESPDGMAKAVAVFMEKYPKLKEALPLVEAQILRVFPPGIILTQELHTDPEECFVCNEIQKLVVGINQPAYTAESYGVLLDCLDVFENWLYEDEQNWIRCLPLLVMI